MISTGRSFNSCTSPICCRESGNSLFLLFFSRTCMARGFWWKQLQVSDEGSFGACGFSILVEDWSFGWGELWYSHIKGAPERSTWTHMHKACSEEERAPLCSNGLDEWIIWISPGSPWEFCIRSDICLVWNTPRRRSRLCSPRYCQRRKVGNFCS